MAEIKTNGTFWVFPSFVLEYQFSECQEPLTPEEPTDPESSMY